MNKSTKIATAVGCVSLALVSGLVMTACGAQTKEIQKEEFNDYYSSASTITHFDKGIHGKIQESDSEKTEFWILKNSADKFQLKADVQTLADSTWTTTTTYVKDDKTYNSKSKTWNPYNESDVNEEGYAMGFAKEGLDSVISQLLQKNSTKYTLKDGKSKIYGLETSEMDGQNTNSAKLSLEYKNNKLVCFDYSAVQAQKSMKLFLEEFSGPISFPADLSTYNREGFTQAGNLQTFKTEIAKPNAKVILTADIELDQSIKVANTATLDLDGHNITLKDSVNFAATQENGSHTWAMFSVEGGNFTVEGKGNIESTNSLAVFNVGFRGHQPSQTGKAGGTLTINNGTFINSGKYTAETGDMEDTVIFVDDGGNLTINDGTFKMAYGDVKQGDTAATKQEKLDAKKFMINKRNNSTANVQIKGGTYYFFNPENGDDSALDDSYLPEGYECNEKPANSGIYVVTKSAE